MPDLTPDPRISAHVEAARTERENAKIEVKFDKDKQERYLVLRKAGRKHYGACNTLGVSPRSVERFASINPDYAEDIRAAELEYLERFEEVLEDKALDGEFGPLKEVLSKRSPDRWGDNKHTLEVKGKIELEAGPGMAQIAALHSRLLERSETLKELNSGEIIDADVVE